MKLEFEKKFILDVRRADELIEDMNRRFSHAEYPPKKIRQLYDDNGFRYRAIVSEDHFIYLRENKKSIKLDTSYTASIEEEDHILADEFEDRWKRTDKRLQKMRYEIPGRYPNHTIMIDFFYSGAYWYAIMAEVETLLTNETEILYLHFQLPLSLGKYLLKEIDNREPDAKIFKSTNMIDTPERIANVKEAYSRLYGSL